MSASLQVETLEVFAGVSKVVEYIEALTARPKTAYQCVARALGFQLSTGSRRITVQGVIEEAITIANSAKIKVEFNDLYDALHEVVAALRSSNPMEHLRL